MIIGGTAQIVSSRRILLFCRSHATIYNVSVNESRKHNVNASGEFAMTITMDMYATAALGLIMLTVGQMIRKKIRFFETFCIPAPVIGGVLFSVLNLVLHITGLLDLQFDETLKDFFMMVFFTTVGFKADFASVKQGGKGLVLFLALTFGLILFQNAVALGISSLMGVSRLLGMCTGSIPMIGGHGTAAAFGPLLEEMGFAGATVYATAAATYGLLAGSIIGGPIARFLIRKNQINTDPVEHKDPAIAEHRKLNLSKSYMFSVYQIIFAMGAGALISYLISLTGFTFPEYIGSMLAAAIMTNVSSASHKFHIQMSEIEDIGSISLSLFLGMAMITLKLWQLAELALPLVILLIAQTVLMALYAVLVAFPVMGRDYDAAVSVAGLCGFGMGATPNALANMQSVCFHKRYSEKAFLIVPLVGALFADFLNAGVLTFLLNLLK